MYFVGDKNENNKKTKIAKEQTSIKTRNSVITEFGLVEELTEEDQAKQQEQ
jgi:hypothetical protein